jgi:Tfp pilus assembly protein PilX
MGTVGIQLDEEVRHGQEVPCRTQDGAVLLLTLIFVLIIAFVLLGLLSLSGNDLKNTSNLQSQRASEYAADSAVDAAIQAVRYSYYAFNSTQSGDSTPCTPNPGASGFVNPSCYTNNSGDDCLPDGTTFINPDRNTATMTINGITMTVDCTGDLSPSSQNTRVITFYACPQSNCSAANATLTATVAFQDYPTSFSTAEDPCNSSPNVADCGTGIVTQSWVVRNANS